MKLINRIKSPTPSFFKKIRTIGLILAGVSATVLTAPVALPSLVLQIASYAAIAGSVASAVSQTASIAEVHDIKEPADGNELSARY